MKFNWWLVARLQWITIPKRLIFFANATLSVTRVCQMWYADSNIGRALTVATLSQGDCGLIVTTQEWDGALIKYCTPDSKVPGANMGLIWGRQDQGGSPCWPHELCYLGCYAKFLLWYHKMFEGSFIEYWTMEHLYWWLCIDSNKVPTQNRWQPNENLVHKVAYESQKKTSITIQIFCNQCGMFVINLASIH